MELTKKQFDQVMSDDDFKKSLAKEQALLIHKDIIRGMKGHISRSFPIPISLAERISGWQAQWIRRNLSIIKTEGQDDSIEFGVLTDAIKERRIK